MGQEEINRKKSLDKILAELQIKKFQQASKPLRQYLHGLQRKIKKNLKYSGLSEDDKTYIMAHIDEILSCFEEVEDTFRSFKTFIIELLTSKEEYEVEKV
jgi:hypothetical protein